MSKVPGANLQQKTIQLFQHQKDGKWVTEMLLGGGQINHFWCQTAARAQNKLIWIICYNKQPP